MTTNNSKVKSYLFLGYVWNVCDYITCSGMHAKTVHFIMTKYLLPCII